MGKTKVHKFKKHLPALKKHLFELKREQTEEVIEEFKEVIEELYSMTFRFWKGGGNQRESRSSRRRIYKVPEVEFSEPEIKISKDAKISVKIHSWVKDSSTGRPHELWYWLDFGTKTIIWPEGSPSASFPMRIVNRTEPGTLRVRSAPSYGERRRIYPGQRRKGIVPRRWSETIGLEFDKKVAGSKLGKRGWKVSDFKVRKHI